MTPGFPPDLDEIELSEAFLDEIQKICDAPLPCEVVTSAPVMENIIEGDAVRSKRDCARGVRFVCRVR